MSERLTWYHNEPSSNRLLCNMNENKNGSNLDANSLASELSLICFKRFSEKMKPITNLVLLLFFKYTVRRKAKDGTNLNKNDLALNLHVCIEFSCVMVIITGLTNSNATLKQQVPN